MWSSWTALVLRVLKVPAAPHLPDYSGEVQIFRAAPNYWTLSLMKWVAAQFFAAAGLALSFLFLRVALPPTLARVAFWLELFEIVGVGTFILQLPATFAMLRLDYELRWYIVTDRSLRIREGLMRVDEKTMTFANIQNLSIRRGPLQRLLGIADLEVRSAGGGATEQAGGKGRSRHDLHIGFFRGVDKADLIRDTLREGVRRHRDSGLGDPEESLATGSQHGQKELEAAAAVLREARLLRLTLER